MCCQRWRYHRIQNLRLRKRLKPSPEISIWSAATVAPMPTITPFMLSRKQKEKNRLYLASTFVGNENGEYFSLAKPRRLPENRVIYCKKNYFGHISRSFSLNRITIRLKCSKNLSQNSFPSLRQLFSDSLLVRILHELHTPSLVS